MDTVININGLTKHFGNITAVDNICFEVTHGQVLGFLGPNGAGKSTTMKMITGFLRPTMGSVHICGHDIEKHPIAAKKMLGYLPEGAPAYPELTPLEFLSFIADIRKITGKNKRLALDSVIERLHLQSVIHQPIDTLSKGFKRRIGLAQAIIHHPKVLILDEPTDGLDPNQKYEVRHLIKEMAEDKIIILSTHILEEVEAICSRAIIIAAGKIIADAAPKELESKAPSHNTIQIKLIRSSAADSAYSALSKIPGINTLEILQEDSNTIYFKVTPEPGQCVLKDIDTLSKQKSWQVTELKVNQGRLDEYFRMLTAERQERN